MYFYLVSTREGMEVYRRFLEPQGALKKNVLTFELVFVVMLFTCVVLVNSLSLKNSTI